MKRETRWGNFARGAATKRGGWKGEAFMEGSELRRLGGGPREETGLRDKTTKLLPKKRSKNVKKREEWNIAGESMKGQ